MRQRRPGAPLSLHGEGGSNTALFYGAAVRRCGSCGLSKSEAEFSWRRKAKGQRDNYCRSCRARYKREHYATNKSRYIKWAGDRRKALIVGNIGSLLEYLSVHPCVDCGEKDPLVLEFDHLRDKEFSISTALRERGWTAILDEIEKCEVVCSNCHRRRTAIRGGFARLAGVVQWKNLTLPRS